ncbi:MAG: hypothetical protein K2K05_02065 [Muribaculaceae bacterium]|nr:hypothetical protein [Muribaculaceae bacterium]
MSKTNSVYASRRNGGKVDIEGVKMIVYLRINCDFNLGCNPCPFLLLGLNGNEKKKV